MFALKITIATLITIFLFYNGARLIVKEKPLMEKLVELSLYLIIIAILVNVVFSIVTFGQIKTKSGEIGNPGIRGQVGEKGDKGM